MRNSVQRQTGYSQTAARNAARPSSGRREVFHPDQPVEFAGKDWGTSDIVYRVLPAFDPENPGQWDRLLLSQDRSALGEWIRFYPMARVVGDPAHSEDAATFVIRGPFETPGAETIYPYQLLYRTVDRAVKTGTDPGGWARLQKFDKTTKRTPLSPPEACGFLRVAVVRGPVYDPQTQKSQVRDLQPWRGLGPDDMTQILLLPGATGKKVQDMLLDWAASTGRDPVAIDQGVFLRMWQAEMGDPRKLVTFPGSNGPRRGWDIQLMDVFENQSPSLVAHEALLRQRLLPSWDDIIKIPTPVEQAHLLAARFDPALIMFAFREFPDWIPDSVRAKAAAQSVHAVPSQYGMPGGQPGYQQPGYPQPGYPPQGYQQPGYPPQGYPQPGYQQPAYPQASQYAPEGFQQQPAAASGYPPQMPQVMPGTSVGNDPGAYVPPAGQVFPPQGFQPVTHQYPGAAPPTQQYPGAAPVQQQAAVGQATLAQQHQAPVGFQPPQVQNPPFDANQPQQPQSAAAAAPRQPAGVDQQVFANATVLAGYDPAAAAAAATMLGVPQTPPAPQPMPVQQQQVPSRQAAGAAAAMAASGAGAAALAQFAGMSQPAG